MLDGGATAQVRAISISRSKEEFYAALHYAPGCRFFVEVLWRASTETERNLGFREQKKKRVKQRSIERSGARQQTRKACMRSRKKQQTHEDRTENVKDQSGCEKTPHTNWEHEGEDTTWREELIEMERL